MTSFTHIVSFPPIEIDGLAEGFFNKGILSFLIVLDLIVKDINFGQWAKNNIPCIVIKPPHHTLLNLIILINVTLTLPAFLLQILLYLRIPTQFLFLWVRVIALDFVDSVRAFRHPACYYAVLTELVFAVCWVTHAILRAFHWGLLCLHPLLYYLGTFLRGRHILSYLLILPKLFRHIGPCIELSFESELIGEKSFEIFHFSIDKLLMKFPFVYSPNNCPQNII